jgi:hypothetical protein
VSIRGGAAPVNLLVTILGVELVSPREVPKGCHSLRPLALLLPLRCVGAVPVTVSMEIYQR